MNTRSSLGFGLIVLASATFGVTSCGNGDGSAGTAASSSTTMPTSGVSVTGSTTGPTATTTGATGAQGSTGSSMETVGQTGNDTSSATTQEPLPVCEIPSLSVFSRSDTDAAWDDNDFSDVIVDASACPPVFVNVTWPHEEGWQNADPSDANHEQVHFTLDSYSGGDLTNKEVAATIELLEDQQGPTAKGGGYIVSLVSVSTYDQVVVVEPTVVPDAGLVDAGLADAGLVVDAGDAAPPPPVTITQTGYTEAESAPEDRITLRHAGDRATVRFVLPNKTAASDSFDPARAIKVNLRVYNIFTGGDTTVSVPVDGTAGDAGVVDGTVDASVADAAIVAPTEPSPGYDYLTSRFGISKFTITDVGAAPAP